MKKPTPATKAKKAAPETAAPAKAKVAKSKAAKPKAAPKVTIEPEVEAEVVKPAAKSVAKSAGAEDATLAKRLAEMTDFALRAYQQSTARISRDPKHAKSAWAKLTLASIEKEMARRVASPGSAPSGVRVGLARPKSEIAKGGKGRG